MLTEGVSDGFTDIVIELDVTGFPVTQSAFEVITQEITSPLASVLVMYVGLFVPTFVAPFFH